MEHLFFIILGMLPGLAWLFFYLHKDANPEPKDMVFLIFLLGAAIGPVAILIQYFSAKAISGFNDFFNLGLLSAGTASLFFINIVFIAPLSEELLKYLVVRWQVLKNPAFDEPVDAMIYLIVSALGFASIENISNIFFTPGISSQLAVSQSTARFLSATLLHALSSGILGYFVASSLLNLQKKNLLFWTGFSLAVAFHGFYNYLAYLIRYSDFFVLAIALLLVLMSGLVGWQFRCLKKQIAICKIR
jgi:RsiW-degrading membrane proteinase PrsW (M82 family)